MISQEDNIITNKLWHIFLCAVVSCLLVLNISIPAFAKPGLPIFLLGPATFNGVLLTAADVDYTVSIEVGGVELTSYQMGSNSAYEDWYLLAIPTDNRSLPIVSCPVGSAGDTAYIYINGIPVDENPVTLEGPTTQTQLEINATK